MSKLNRFSGSERDWTAQYAAIGRFIVEFEWICWHIRFSAVSILQAYGLKKWPLGEIIFNQRVFTGDPLFSCYVSMVEESLDSQNPLIPELEKIYSDFQKLSKTRNDLLHASYLIGIDTVELTDQEAPTESYVEKRTPDKKGARTQILANTLNDMEKYIKEAEELKYRVKELTKRVMLALYRDA